MSFTSVLSILTKSLTETCARTIFLLTLLASIKNKIANIRAYLLREQNKKQEEVINDLTRRLALKDRILSIISHDIRSPLNNLKALLQLLNEKKISRKEFHEISSNLDRQVGQLSQFLENLLKWLRNINTEIKPNFEQVGLQRAVDESVGLYDLQARSKGVSIRSKISKGIIIYADEEMVKLVLRNLINNALKFCDEGDTISIGARERPGEVFISVHDTGQGIPEENLSKVFDFSHISTVGTKSEIGTGLGLTLCKEFIEKMGGTINVTSVEGSGSKFEFTVNAPASPSYEFQKFIDGNE